MTAAPATTAAPLFMHTRGSGERVVCLHSSTGTHAQWRTLQERMASRWEVMAPDLHGHGRSPAWPEDGTPSLHVDAAAVARQTGIAAGEAVHLVGHSYGAAVALQIALSHPGQVHSLTLYEPVAFGLLHKAAPGDEALDEIEAVASSVAALVRLGALQDAARVFVGYWGGAAAWGAMNDDQQRSVMARMAAVPRHFEALFAARWDGPVLRRLRMPVLLMRGEATRASARRVSELLSAALPHAQCVELGGAGHLGPLTHRDTVASWMLGHLDPQLASESFVSAQAA